MYSAVAAGADPGAGAVEPATGSSSKGALGPDEFMVADRHAQGNEPALCRRLVATPNFHTELAYAWQRGAAAGMIKRVLQRFAATPSVYFDGVFAARFALRVTG